MLRPPKLPLPCNEAACMTACCTSHNNQHKPSAPNPQLHLTQNKQNNLTGWVICNPCYGVNEGNDPLSPCLCQTRPTHPSQPQPFPMPSCLVAVLLAKAPWVGAQPHPVVTAPLTKVHNQPPAQSASLAGAVKEDLKVMGPTAQSQPNMLCLAGSCSASSRGRTYARSHW